MCPKSNETGVIKALLKNIETYQNQIPSMYTPFHFKTLVHSLFPGFNTLLEGIFWDLFELRRRDHFDQIHVRKMGSFQSRFNLGEKEKITGNRLGKYGGVSRLQCSFVRETNKY